MYKRYTLLLSLLCVAALCRAQVTLSVQVPPTGVMQKAQLWNLVLVNTADAPVDVNIQLVLLTNDNKPVLSATTRRITLNKGVKQIGVSDVAPVQYDYLSSVYNVDRNPDGFLPIGNFQACFTINKLVSDTRTELAEECVPVEVTPLSPPQLNTPFDRDTLSIAYPSFTWLPPTPLPLFSDLSYDLVLVEMQPGQSAEQAIQQNIPLYTAGNVDNLSLLYPTSNKALDTARWYAWRIVAKNNHQLVAQSEVWTFTVRGPQTAAVTPVTTNYILLRKGQQASGINTVSNRLLGLKYYSFDAPHEGLVRILNSDGTVVQEIKQHLVYGDNFLSYKLGGAYAKNKVYRAEIIDLQNGRYTVLFQLN